MFRIFSALFGAFLLVAGLAGCATSPADAVAVPETAITVSADTIVVDVRTPDEFAQGHVGGAHLLDLTSGEFAAALPQLDPDVEYLVYCRSGNRSAQAVALMQDAGFTNVIDLGSVEQAAEATQTPIIR